MIKNFLWYRPYTKQKTFHDLGKDCKQRLFLGGNRTGKSLTGALETAMHLTGNYPDWWEGFRFDGLITAWACGDTTNSVRESLQMYYLGKSTGTSKMERAGVIPESLRGKIVYKHGSGGAVESIMVRHAKGGFSQLQFRSYEQGRKAFQGAKIQFCHCDEEPPEDIFYEIAMRLVGFGGAQTRMILTATPLSGFTNVVNSFIKNPEDNSLRESAKNYGGRLYINASWEDNPYLDKEEIEELTNNTPDHELEARKYGWPIAGLGMVYPYMENKITCESFSIPDDWRRCFGIDFGYRNTAIVFGARNPETDTIYIYDELICKEKTIDDIIQLFNKRPEESWICGVCDPAGNQTDGKTGESIIKMYQNLGLRITKANNKVMRGIEECSNRFQSGKLKIFRDKCPSLLDERRSYSFGKDNKPQKKNDHALDAMRYLVMSHSLAEVSLEQTFSKGYNSYKYDQTEYRYV